MPDLAPTETVARFFELQYAGDFDTAFRELATEDFTWVVGSRDNDELRTGIPWAGHRHNGKAGYMELTGQLFGEFEVIDFRPDWFHDAGDRVLVEGHFRFKHRETGYIADSDWMARFDMRDGRIAGGQFYENTFAVAAARVSD